MDIAVAMNTGSNDETIVPPDPADPFFSYEPLEDAGESATAEKTDEYLYGNE